MKLIPNLFGKKDSAGTSELGAAVEHAVSSVEPLLLQRRGYPRHYHRPVAAALEYARQLADSLPGPVRIDREAYARDPFVHILFPDINAIPDAITSSLAMQEYLRHPPSGDEFYALMGMRRVDKKLIGMELAGETLLQRDVVQQTTYFVSHTLEAPSPDESLARERIATQFFSCLVRKVKARIDQRKQSRESLISERDELTKRLRFVGDIECDEAEQRLADLSEGLRALVESLDPDRYLDDFEAVLLHPEEHLRLVRTSATLDSMGIRREDSGAGRGREFTFSELVGYDRRNWTVTLVRCVNLEYETFAERLDKAYRYLTL